MPSPNTTTRKRFRAQISTVPLIDRKMPVERMRQLAVVKPKRHRDFHVMAENIDGARAEVRRIVEAEGMKVRAMSVGTDGSVKCIAMKG
jgi:hypothetical protein